MLSSLNQQDLTFVFMGVVICLMIASVALFWSIEDQRVKRRITKR